MDFVPVKPKATGLPVVGHVQLEWTYGHSPSYRWLSVIGAIGNNLNFSHAVCFTFVISAVNTDRKLPLYFKPQNTLNVCYVRVINISYQEHSYL